MNSTPRGCIDHIKSLQTPEFARSIFNQSFSEVVVKRTFNVVRIFLAYLTTRGFHQIICTVYVIKELRIYREPLAATLE